MNALELARRQPVWLALAEFYVDTELQLTDFERIKAVFDQSGYSPQELRQIDYDEVAPLLVPNLLSVAGEWAGFDETALLAALRARTTSPPKRPSLLPLRWLWRRGIDFFNDRYFQRVFAS